ncbi:transcriptional regulator [Klebsiella variicola]|uniref:helix-turn-helix domain-containing protein n=1 Tax=Klebsiella pneumoniae complex TaxID=3390273 RepID=UPI00218161A1|nr:MULTISPECIES: XRE family transcriptional regulator [Klebsiella]MBK2434043.1 ImmA/IrrE family metallo-endopeptidase [Klebsiella pneumoniae]HBS4240320.1 ImmA/IrrE family metallo-endopeptidase [Klebsiella quasipneumoniae subsp. quasipneumoniae]MEB6595007.1 XRE family transcriptional regulator [Klebsiella quasipneumoniae]GKK96357.1 transcriptional regulator [Klebsiella variicola]HCI8717533.1 ImmA/IrrE family metallo-endopeptidase [Klebsiella variicola]
MFGERLKRARSAAGLSMKELSLQAGVSATMIKKYEHNESMPSSGVLVKMSRALGVRNEYFFRPAKYELKGIEYRKRSTVAMKVLNRIKADVLDQAERWMELCNIWPSFPLPSFVKPKFSVSLIDDYNQIETIANELRDYWGLGNQPVTSMIDILESHGILVIVTDVDSSEKFDGLQATVSSKPVVVISSQWPGDRQRFTLAHELGHLILHDMISKNLDEEKACNRFSGAFIFPEVSVRKYLGNKRSHLEVQELYLLKMDYGLSMMACIYRAKDLGIITDAKFKDLFMYFSVRKWRSQEPGQEYPAEQTSMFKQLVFRGLGEGILSESKAAELLGISLVSFHQARKLESSDDNFN